MQLFGLKNCDTCRKAMKVLTSVELVDVREDGVPSEILTRAHAEFGAALVNTRSTTWRNLSKEQRQTPPVDLLKAHPTVMKRPLIMNGSKLYLGWSDDVKAALSTA